MQRAKAGPGGPGGEPSKRWKSQEKDVKSKEVKRKDRVFKLLKANQGSSKKDREHSS